jgi:hypothetical protein
LYVNPTLPCVGQNTGRNGGYIFPTSMEARTQRRQAVSVTQ